MDREITSHRVNGLNESLRVLAVDAPGHGGACHEYEIRFEVNGGIDADVYMTPIQFQNGPLQIDGPNGVSNEALLAIVEDRLLGFQSGQYACRENAIALTKIQEAMMWLQKRTRDRVARGVEGTDQL